MKEYVHNWGGLTGEVIRAVTTNREKSAEVIVTGKGKKHLKEIGAKARRYSTSIFVPYAQMGNGLKNLLTTLWIGGMWVIGVLVAPILFKALDNSLAGMVVGKLFHAIGRRVS